MKNYFAHKLILLSTILLLGSCSQFQKVLKSNNVDEKYQAAVKYYEKNDYYKSGLIFEEIIPLLKGRAESERAQFYYANAHYQQKQYLLSAYYFKNFVETYPRSEFAEEAMFMHAKSLYKDSPNYNLDQTNTYSAMEALQDFLNRYPQSKFKDEANTIYEGLAKKLEIKAFENAKLYLQLRRYQAAVVSLANFQKEYPSSTFNEEAAYLKIESQYYLARESVQAKQQERFYEAIEFYQEFVDRYPESRFLKSAQNYYDNSINQIERLRLSNL